MKLRRETRQYSGESKRAPRAHLRGDDVAGPDLVGQLPQQIQSRYRKERCGRSWATQLIDAIGCRWGAQRVDLPVSSRAGSAVAKRHFHHSDPIPEREKTQPVRVTRRSDGEFAARSRVFLLIGSDVVRRARS